MPYKYTFYCGLSAKGKRVNPDLYRDVMKERYPGYTELQGRGVWCKQEEESILFVVLVRTDDLYDYSKETARLLRKAGDQEDVLLEIQDVQEIWLTEVGEE